MVTGGYLLDTDTVIFAMRRQGAALRERMRLRAGRLFVSSITVMELEYGAARSSDPDRNRQAVREVLATTEILEFDAPAAIKAGVIRADLAGRGTPIGSYDVLIAGHADAAGLRLITHNTREFSRVQGLDVDDWANTEG